MMLVAHAIDEAFERLTKLYGREFTSKYEPEALEETKAQWCREVAGIPEPLDAIAWALKNLPERAPNAIQFRNLCRQAPSRRQAAMPLDGGGPVRGPTAHELAALHRLRDDLADGQLMRRPSKQWAHDLIAKHERGETVGSYPLKCAREVVGMRSSPQVDEPQVEAFPAIEAPW